MITLVCDDTVMIQVMTNKLSITIVIRVTTPCWILLEFFLRRSIRAEQRDIF